MRVLLSVLVLSLGLLTAPAHAGEASKFQEIASELNLNATQKASVEDILYKSRAARIEIKSRLQRGELDLKHALAAPTLDEKAVATATDAVSRATTDLVKNRVDQIVSIRKQLNPDQWEKLKVIWEDLKADKDDDRGEDRGDDRDDE